MKLKVASTVGQNTTLSVRDDVFGAPFNPTLVAQTVRVYLANQRQGTSKTKTRSEINRSKKKWFKQKGTGNARHGARTPSIFVGGGVSHGPTGHENWSLKVSSTMKKVALASVLSAQAEKTVVMEDINQLDGKTASAYKLFENLLPNAQHILVVLSKHEPMVARSLRNLPYVYVTDASRLNTYEVAYSDAIVLTKESVKMLEDRLGREEKKAKEKEVEKKVEKAEVKMKKPVAATTVKKVPAKKIETKKPAAKVAKTAAKPKTKTKAK